MKERKWDSRKGEGGKGKGGRKSSSRLVTDTQKMPHSNF